jgi:hypothetical protein
MDKLMGNLIKMAKDQTRDLTVQHELLHKLRKTVADVNNEASTLRLAIMEENNALRSYRDSLKNQSVVAPASKIAIGPSHHDYDDLRLFKSSISAIEARDPTGQDPATSHALLHAVVQSLVQSQTKCCINVPPCASPVREKVDAGPLGELSWEPID